MQKNHKKFWTGPRVDFLCQTLALRLGPLTNTGFKLEFKQANDVAPDIAIKYLVDDLVKYWYEDYKDYRESNPNKRYPLLTAEAIHSQIDTVLSLDSYVSDFVPFAQGKISAFNAGLITSRELNKLIAGSPEGIIAHWQEKIKAGTIAPHIAEGIDELGKTKPGK
jgi:hypothetical protein